MDGPPRTFAILLLAFLVVLSGPVAVVSATSGALFGIQSVDPDQVLIRVDVQEDGDAQWRVEYRVRLDTENETEAFESLKRDIEANETAYLTEFRNRIRSTVATAENTTGRNMSAAQFNITAQITQLPQRYGVLTYTFTWTNFAVVEGDRLIAGDALAGFFLDSETTLAIGWPADYHATTVTPEPTERQTDAVVWRGPLDFADGEPRVIVEPEPAGGTTDGPNGGSGPPGGVGIGAESLIAILVVLLTVGAGFVYYRRRGFPTSQRDPDASGTSTNGGFGPDGAGAAGTSTPTGGAGSESGGVESGEAAGAPGGAAAGGDQEPPPAELLSNEERVVHFLEEQGGRAKQQEIVDGLGWTDAKTSQVLSGMASDDQIEKFRIGRENVVKLPDDDDTLGPSV